MENQNQAELPKYECHKKVWALKIKSIEGLDKQPIVNIIIVPEDSSYAPFSVTHDYIEKHTPVAGGYYVVYEDGYNSFSPAEAFESGYTKI